MAKRSKVVAAALAGDDTQREPDRPAAVKLRAKQRVKVKRPTALQAKQLALAKKELGGEALTGITYYVLVDAKGKHVYDAYRYNADCGKVFKAGTTRVVASIIQFEADPCDDALAAGLDQAMHG